MGAPALYPYTSTFIEGYRGNKSFKLPIINLESTADALAQLCNSTRLTSPDIAQASRQITGAELQTCLQNHVPVVEVKLGYEAIVLLRSKLYGGLNLAPRDVFLALAKRVPDPEHPQSLIDNPNTSWDQVNGSLPYGHIEFLGPPLESPLARAFVDLLVQKGCDTYPWLAALKDLDESQYDTVCRSLREDGVYVAIPGYPNDLPTRLETEPAAIGIANANLFKLFSNRVSASPIGGILPSCASVESGSSATISRINASFSSCCAGTTLENVSQPSMSLSLAAWRAAISFSSITDFRIASRSSPIF